MNAPVRLGLYAGGLVAVFAAALLVGRYAVPDQSSQTGGADHAESSRATHAHPGHGGTGPAESAAVGTSQAVDGYLLTALSGPSRTDMAAPVSFTITGPDGTALTRFTPAHDKELHLIIVRADGAHFAHVHPTRNAAGEWSVPWRAPAGGTYRVFTDFIPGNGAERDPIVLSGTLQVAGDFTPATPEPNRVSTVDGFTVTLDGDLAHDRASTLTAQVRHTGQPVALQPYLGALGHLVVLRAGDLAYTHVHPMHEAHAGPPATSDVMFAATAPSAGRYLAYFDFQVDGVVRTAAFVVDSTQ